MRLTLQEIMRATKGRLISGSPEAVVTGVSTDSRTIRKGDLFVALRGETHDGHDHLDEVRRKGAAAAVVRKPVRGGAANVIRVGDTLRALGDLAHYWRKKFPVCVVGVTGSNGKTTAKDMIAAVLSRRFRVLKTEGNYNNLIGLPHTLFRLRGDEDIAVLEMGMNHFGEIDRLAEIAEPSVGVITNIGRAHLEGLRGIAGVARAKGEILERLLPGGLAVLPRDSAFFPALRRRARDAGARVISFGSGTGADYRSRSVRLRDLRGLSFSSETPVGRASLMMPVVGRHNVLNALTALAVGDHFGVPRSAAKSALGRFHAGSKRMEIIRLPKGVTVINDCYNANPDSMAASLCFLKEAAIRRRSVAVLGDMLELGRYGKASHRDLGREAARAGVGLLVAIGPHAADVTDGARRAGLSRNRLFSFEAADQAVPALRSLVRPRDLILVKGSRGMKMERITEALH